MTFPTHCLILSLTYHCYFYTHLIELIFNVTTFCMICSVLLILLLYSFRTVYSAKKVVFASVFLSVCEQDNSKSC